MSDKSCQSHRQFVPIILQLLSILCQEKNKKKYTQVYILNIFFDLLV